MSDPAQIREAGPQSTWGEVVHCVRPLDGAEHHPANKEVR